MSFPSLAVYLRLGLLVMRTSDQQLLTLRLPPSSRILYSFEGYDLVFSCFALA